MPDPLEKKRITDKILLLWELNPEWSIGQTVDAAHFAAQAESDNTDLALMPDEQLEVGLDILIDLSRDKHVNA